MAAGEILGLNRITVRTDGTSATRDEAGAIEISAVVPAYDRESTVGRAIESALGQSSPPQEVIVVDDGSRDGTRDAIEAFGDRVRAVPQENAGAGEARNRGVREARSEWVAFLDSDDYWMPHHLARMRHAIRQTAGAADLYFADMRQTPEEGGRRLWEVAGFSIPADFALCNDASEWAMQRIQPMMLQSSLVRRETYLARGGLWPALRCRHDTHLFFKLCLGGPACAVAGCGTEQTSDDRSGARVTAAFGFATESFLEESIAMYDDLLSGAYPLTPAQRSELRGRLSMAHLQLARRRLGQGRWASGGSHLVRGTAASPQHLLARLRRAAPAG